MFKKLSLIAVMIAFLSNSVYAESDTTSATATHKKTVHKNDTSKKTTTAKKNVKKTTKVD